MKDPKKFGDFLHTQKRDPCINMKSPTMMWDYWSLNPESLHQVMILMSDRGMPFGYRFMNGYGSHTFSFVNADGVRSRVKFHFKNAQGIKNFPGDEANGMKSKDLDFAQRDLLESIDRGEFPRWNLKIQVMPEADAKTYRINPFDLTKVWPHADYPLIDVGVMELNENPDNYFAHVEQSASAPAHVVDGIGYSPDKMLQGRLLSYPDAHRYRLRGNYEQIPVNRCPYAVNNFQRDGQIRVDVNGGKNPNYFPNSFDTIVADERYKEPAWELENSIADWYDRNGEGPAGVLENDHYSQPGDLYRNVMTIDQRKHLIANIVGAMIGIGGPKREVIMNRQLCHWFRCDVGMAVAQGLGVGMDVMQSAMELEHA